MKKDSNPLVSILVPVYNCEPFLDECISSIINQDYPNLQIVLGNDGSTDGSLDILKKYANIDSRIEIFSRENKGVAPTRNDLLDRIKGDYFLFVDADDWIEPNMVSYLLGLIKRHNADIAVCSNVKDLNPKDQTEENIQIWDQKTAIKKFLFHKELSGSLWNKLICTRLLHKEPESSIPSKRFNPEIYYGEDALFFWDLFPGVQFLAISEKQLYHYRPNPSSLSISNWSPEKKGSGHFVWQKITEDTAKNWPEYLDISKSRFALESMWALYFASCANYPFDQHIKLRQTVIKENIKSLRKYKIDGFIKFLTALVFAHSYAAARLIHLFKS